MQELLHFVINEFSTTSSSLSDLLNAIEELSKGEAMVFPVPVVLLKLGDWLLSQLLPNSCHRAAIKLRSYGATFFLPNISKFPMESTSRSTLISDFHGTLLRSQSLFPYFMLVSFEAGGLLRATVLLLLSPVLSVLSRELELRAMIFVTFCGLSVKTMDSVSRAVLPKFYLEDLNREAYEIFASVSGGKFVFTSLPAVMVESFLKEYLGVDDVVGTELQRIGKAYTGLVSGSGLVVKHRSVRDYFKEKKPDIGLGSSSSLSESLFLSFCKEAYLVNKENKSTRVLPKDKYPKPLIFHDGRLAFFPTPLSTLSMLMFLPLGLTLSIFRISIGVFLPYKLAILLAAMSGLKIRARGRESVLNSKKQGKGVLYVCNHRTLLDPVLLSNSLARPFTALTYSLSTFSELISPLRTVRLTRDSVRDRDTMGRLLRESDLVVCPEGTTCREPYLLRFSSLFAELTDEIVPVAVDTEVSMFYGTTAGGLKCLDPIVFFMNPWPLYSLRVLGKVPTELTCEGGKSRHEVANWIQRQIAEALGFECTALTRRDKYLMLAGNEGVVADSRKRS